jgi:hypothetical protein
MNPRKKILQPNPGKLKDTIYELNSYVVYKIPLQKIWLSTKTLKNITIREVNHFNLVENDT